MSGSTSRQLRDFFEALLAAYGPQHWWPGQTPTEIVVGALLTQNTNWKNVERAIARLRQADLLDWERLRDIEPDRLAEVIRPAGSYNVKARRLKNFVHWLFERFDGRLEALAEMSIDDARAVLLNVNGIGRETADAILLYALGRPVFVVDAYTARVLWRHRLIDDDAGYDQIKELLESALPADAKLFNEYHALLVEVGKRHCRPRPRCEGCPLERFEHHATATGRAAAATDES